MSSGQARWFRLLVGGMFAPAEARNYPCVSTTCRPPRSMTTKATRCMSTSS